jgi:hypothetical protein
MHKNANIMAWDVVKQHVKIKLRTQCYGEWLTIAFQLGSSSSTVRSQQKIDVFSVGVRKKWTTSSYSVHWLGRFGMQ